MSDRFFGNYKAFVVIPAKEKGAGPKAFDPSDYSRHFILTFSLYDSLITCWKEAGKFKVQPRQGLARVIDAFNLKHDGTAYLQMLEMEDDQPYFVLALSCKSAADHEQAAINRITQLLEKDFATDLLIGETWYQLIGAKGKFERKLFSYNIQPYAQPPK
ncbi:MULTISPECIES: hypothetical protein [Brevibacillus]|jgi:hypothetical protein|uniref:Uncharacterized protein n=1 Tax=Brevibacillus parabrevis TaxID=54914 RepID=A0A4Y3PU67_BREPA|nr:MULTISPECIES: hypothetical protein [Brevibacillus]MBU8715461.1 hypothetical protein [Brevibacillus parabrevis]MDH6349597.1 hypothetical protein [Brevibacillus sp. 1238]MED1725771.1 hypothetical protein [Brevibacillus parabrevis]MED2254394.1 hypothetical protein [Brevibacillus parabrevis]NRQ54593.1 hypothetical protein [Brevibacillus sp. HD1.4A]